MFSLVAIRRQPNRKCVLRIAQNSHGKDKFIRMIFLGKVICRTRRTRKFLHGLQQGETLKIATASYAVST